ncbi:type II secretion system protein GspM [Legionella massiliensis]|nr:type II secretion system protein GspM [Legionella massiliensis]
MNYWNNLNERERWTTGLGILFTLLYLFYLLIYSPLSTAVSTQSKQLIEKQETLAWMEQVRQQPKNQKTLLAISNAKLLALIGNQLSDKAFRTFTYQLQQTGPGDIQISFERVPYKMLLDWLWKLNSDYAITLKQFSVEPSNTPGVVKVLVVLAAK